MRALIGLLLVGCGTLGLRPKSGDSAEGGGGDSRRVEEGLFVEDISPDWAPLGGGTEVVIEGGGFDRDVRVAFGGAELDVTRLDDDELLVYSPEVHAEASVDVRVWTEEEEVEVEDGFTFADSDPDPGSDGGAGGDGASDGGSDGGSAEGRVSGLLQLSYLALGCPECFGLSSDLLVDASAGFHEPVEASWFDWIPPNGSCEVDPSKDPASTGSRDLGSVIELMSGTAEIALRWDSGDEIYVASGLSSSAYARSAAYDLLVSDGGEWGPFEVENALLTTSGFADIAPLSIFNPASSAFAPMSASAFSFAWEPAGVSEAVVIDVVVYDPGGSTLLQEIYCIVDDEGGATLPREAFSGMPDGALLAIYIYRWQTAATEHPVDGSTIEAATIFGGIGTATLRP